MFPLNGTISINAKVFFRILNGVIMKSFAKGFVGAALICSACLSPILSYADTELLTKVAVDKQEAEWAKIRIIKEKYEEAAALGRVDILSPFISPEFTGVTLTGEEIRGYEGLNNFNLRMREVIGEGATHEMKISYAPGAMYGDIAIAHGTTQEVLITSLRNRFAYTSLWTAILRKENGEWKLIRVQQSIDPVNNEFVDTFTMRKIGWYGGGGVVAGLILGVLASYCLRRRNRSC